MNVWLDLDGQRLWHGEQEIPLSAKAFTMLCYLAEQPDRLLSHQTLLEAVWPGVYVTEDSIRHYIRELRLALQDDPQTPQFIATVHGRGYRFIGHLPARSAGKTGGEQTLSLNKKLPSLPDTPSIAVLPFTNLSGDPEQAYFCEGFSDDLITDLCRLRGLLVIARHSSFAYQDKAVDLRQIGQELGVRYLLEGSVRQYAGQLRINAQLIDASSGEHLWAERYDEPLQYLFALQDDIRAQIVSAIEVKLIEGEQAQVWRRTTTHAKAYELFLRARRALYESQGFSQDACYRAQALMEQALQLDPDFCAALVRLGIIHHILCEFSADPKSHLDQEMKLANRALRCDPQFGDTYGLLSVVHLFRCEFAQSLQAAERAVEYAPNSYTGMIFLGGALADANRIQEALALMEKALRINPLPVKWDHYSNLGYIYLCARDFDAALATLEKSVRGNPGNMKAQRYLLLAYAEAGRIKEAQAQACELLKLNPHYSVSKHLRWWILLAKDSIAREQRAQSLIAAGLSP